MARFRCLNCSKIIECDPYDPAVLINHIRTDHPEIELPKNEPMDRPETENLICDEKALNDTKLSARRSSFAEACNRVNMRKQGLPDIDLNMEETVIKEPDFKPIYTRKYKITTPITPRSPQKRRMYKTSVEKWRPAKGVIYCPKCGATKKPIIKSKSEKLSYSTAGAACILTCWPLCFLPCLFQAPTRDYLHCAECHNFLGMYDKQRNCVRPNRDYVDGSRPSRDYVDGRRLSHDYVDGSVCEKPQIDDKRRSTATESQERNSI